MGRIGKCCWPIYGLFIKNIILFIRNKWTNLFIIIVPVILIIFTGIVQLILNFTLTGSPTIVRPDPIPLNFFLDSTTSPLFHQKYFVLNTSAALGFKSPTGIGSGVLNNVLQYNFGSERHPYFTPFQNQTQMLHARDMELQFSNETNRLDGLYTVDVLNQSHLSYRVEYIPKSNQNIFSRSFGRIFKKTRMMSILNSAYFQQITNRMLIVLVKPFPIINDVSALPFMDIIGFGLFPFAISFLFPVFLYQLVHEEENELKEMMQMMGLSESVYFVVNYVSFFVIYMTVCLLFVSIELAWQVKTFAHTPIWIIFLLFFLWGHIQIILSFLFKLFIKKSSNSLVVVYLYTIVTILVAEIFCATVYLERDVPLWFWFMPPFAFYRICFIIFMECLDFECISSDFAWNSQIGLGFIFLASQVVFLIACYVVVLMNPIGLLKSCFVWIRRTANMESSSNFDGIRLVNFSKDKRVKNLSFDIEKSQTFGLLGKNGAGKTTTIKMLIGMEYPSSGTANIFGHEVSSHYISSGLREIIGISPQFDIVWNELTIREHVDFYSRLKGMYTSGGEILQKVGLLDHQHKLVKQVSGGMKRRLSLAIALIGSPKVIFLDEPTTGLDIESKRQVWDCIKSIDQTILVTTHSLEEVSVLCSQIGIMKQGELVAYGSINDLKEKFGNGHQLKIVIPPSEEIPRTLRDLEPLYKEKNTYTYLLKDNISSTLAEIKSFDWSIHGTTMEDVFVNVIGQDE